MVGCLKKTFGQRNRNMISKAGNKNAVFTLDGLKVKASSQKEYDHVSLWQFGQIEKGRITTMGAPPIFQSIAFYTLKNEH